MKVIIADDEPLARERLRMLLAEQPDVRVVATAHDGASALEACADERPDLVLLDISMPGMDGLEAARRLAALEPRPAVVFCTAYDEHALAAFDAHAVDYVVKPIRAERLAAALDRAARFRNGPPVANAMPPARRSHLSARMRGALRLIPVQDIRYLQAEEKYVVVHHANGEDLIEDSLKSLEAEFGERFIRVHRNCLVASDQIKELAREADGREIVRLRNDPASLEVSRRCLPGLRQRLKSL